MDKYIEKGTSYKQKSVLFKISWKKINHQVFDKE